MKAGRKHKAGGGEAHNDPPVGKKEWEEDLDTKPERYTKSPKVEDAAEERKKGGRAKRKSGGHVHHEDMSKMKHAKHIGNVRGEEAKHHAGKMPRKSGGRANSTDNPLSSAAKGKVPREHKEEMIS
jgi:hypothetical protein